jgi:hypothetical protein
VETIGENWWIAEQGGAYCLEEDLDPDRIRSIQILIDSQRELKHSPLYELQIEFPIKLQIEFQIEFTLYSPYIQIHLPDFFVTMSDSNSYLQPPGGPGMQRQVSVSLSNSATRGYRQTAAAKRGTYFRSSPDQVNLSDDSMRSPVMRSSNSERKT